MSFSLRTFVTAAAVASVFITTSAMAFEPVISTGDQAPDGQTVSAMLAPVADTGRVFVPLGTPGDNDDLPFPLGILRSSPDQPEGSLEVVVGQEVAGGGTVGGVGIPTVLGDRMAFFGQVRYSDELFDFDTGFLLSGSNGVSPIMLSGESGPDDETLHFFIDQPVLSETRAAGIVHWSTPEAPILSPHGIISASHDGGDRRILVSTDDLMPGRGVTFEQFNLSRAAISGERIFFQGGREVGVFRGIYSAALDGSSNVTPHITNETSLPGDPFWTLNTRAAPVVDGDVFAFIAGIHSTNNGLFVYDHVNDELEFITDGDVFDGVSIVWPRLFDGSALAFSNGILAYMAYDDDMNETLYLHDRETEYRVLGVGDELDGGIVEEIELGSNGLHGNLLTFLAVFESGETAYRLSVASVIPSDLIEIDIAVRPGGGPNPVNLNANGVLPVVILSTEDFNAADVDVATVLLADPDVILDSGVGAPPMRSQLTDISGNGLDDLRLFFSIADIAAVGAMNGETTEAMLIGMTFDGVEVFGSDNVRIVPPAGRGNRR